MGNQIYLWNVRGRVTKTDSSKAKKLLGRGYLRPTEKELQRIEAGTLTYSQLYDQGASVVTKRRDPEPEKIEIKKHGDILDTEKI